MMAAGGGYGMLFWRCSLFIWCCSCISGISSGGAGRGCIDEVFGKDKVIRGLARCRQASLAGVSRGSGSNGCKARAGRKERFLDEIPTSLFCLLFVI